MIEPPKGGQGWYWVHHRYRDARDRRLGGPYQNGYWTPMFYQGPYEFDGQVEHIFLWHEGYSQGLALEDIVEYQGPIHPNGEILC